MHKNIAMIIQRIVQQSPYDFGCEIKGNDTNGFWEVKLHFESRGDAHSESLVRLLKSLGMVFGEGLWVKDKGKIVTIS